MGSVGVGVFLVESTGSAYDWTDAEVTQSLDGVYAGLAWWASQDLRANLSFANELHVREPTAWEPIQYSLDDDWQWIDGIMANLGYMDPDPWSKTLHYNNDLRSRLGTDWAYSIFIADSDDGVNQGRFTNDQYAHAYYGGPWIAMSRYSSWAYNSGDYFRAVPAHETGHIFYASDEYDSGPVMYSGYLDCPDNNGAYGIMNTNVLYVSASTRCQIGWVDSDTDGVFDILDVPPETSLVPYAPDPAGETRVTYSGSATVTALPNRNPLGRSNDVTISRISKVETRVDSGPWIPANPADGAFDGPSEVFTFAVDLPLASSADPLVPVRRETEFTVSAHTLGAASPHTIEAHAEDTEGNTDATPASDALGVSGQAVANLELWSSHDGGAYTLYGMDPVEPWSWSFNASARGSDGEYRFYTIALNMTGGRESAPASADASTFVDATLPTVGITGPAEGFWAASTSVEVVWTTQDAGSGVDQVLVALDGSPPTNETGAARRIFDGLGEGAHTVQVTTVDHAGNAASASIGFGVDVTAPSILVEDPGSGGEILQRTLVLRWTAVDAESGVDSYEVQLDDGEILRPTAANVTFEGLSDGTHRIRVKALDVAGNAEELIVTFRVHADWATGGGPLGWISMGMLIAALVAGAVVAVLLVRRRHRP